MRPPLSTTYLDRIFPPWMPDLRRAGYDPQRLEPIDRAIILKALQIRGIEILTQRNAAIDPNL